MSDRLPARAGVAMERVLMEREVQGQMLDLARRAGNARTARQKAALAQEFSRLQDRVHAVEARMGAMKASSLSAQAQSLEVVMNYGVAIDRLEGIADPAVISEITYQRNLALGAITTTLEKELVDLHEDKAYEAPEREMTLFEKLVVGEKLPPGQRPGIMAALLGPKREAY